MSEILKEQQWQRRRAAKLQRVSQPRKLGAGRKTTAPQKPVDVAAKAKVAKKGPAAAAEPTASGKQLKSEPKNRNFEHATPHQETVSLIDRKRPAKKSEESEVKTKRTVLPPISRIRASLEATSKPQPPTPVPPPEPRRPEPEEQPLAEADSAL